MTEDELRYLLETYFEGPISDTHVDKLAAAVREMTAERAVFGGLISGMKANSRNFAGQLWRETLLRSNTTPKLELAMVYAAASRAGYPRPKPYCPDTIAGTWQQATPGAVTWQLGATGTFKSDDALLSDYTRWAVQRSLDHSLIASAILVSHKDGRVHSMVIAKLTQNELEVDYIAGGREKVRYSLTRGDGSSQPISAVDPLAELLRVLPPVVDNPPQPTPVGTYDRAAIEQHAEWFASGKRHGQRLDLRHHDFSKQNLGNPNLTAARLLKVKLDGADLRYITLDQAELLAVSANGANFSWASLQGAVLDKGSYVRASFELVSLDGAHATGTDFTDAYFERTRWAGTRFEDVTARRAHFGSSVLDAGKFIRCDLREASFVNAQTVLPSTTGVRFEDCDLRDTRWAGRDLSGATFVRCKLAGSQGPVSGMSNVTVLDCDLNLEAWSATLAPATNSPDQK